MSQHNSQIIIILDQLSNIMLKRGESFRAKAYLLAKDAIQQYSSKIENIAQLKNIPNIGKSCLQYIDEFLKTGQVEILEQERNNPINIFADIYGVGPKKAKEIVELNNIRTIKELREKQEQVLNKVQQVGLKYYEQLLQRIPRPEIDHFAKVFEKVANTQPGLQFEIVGSYRRLAQDSGDIDLIITSQNESHYIAFIDLLIKTKVILEVLSRGKSKCLVIAKIPTAKIPNENIARRIDFLYAPPNEYPFSLLYFTGSKIFNTNMRAHAQKQGYSLNEHGLLNTYTNKMVNDTSINSPIQSEKDIFQFLKLVYISPEERKGELIYIKKELKETEQELIKENKQTLIQNYKQKGTQYLKVLSSEKIKELILWANEMYHTNGNPIMTDLEFDELKEYYEATFCCKLEEVGAPIEASSVKALLPYEMWSMDKIKLESGINNDCTKSGILYDWTKSGILYDWKKQYSLPSCQYVLSCKLDGVSGLLQYENNKIHLYTRGNGKIGQDISHLIPYLRLPKLNIHNQTLVIRGEFMISKKAFKEKYAIESANARNFVAGLINRNTVDKEKMKDIDFVTYELIEPANLYPNTQQVLLKKYGFNNVYSSIVPIETLTNDYLSKVLIEQREKYLYEIDGLICCHDYTYPRISGNPKHAFAFKMAFDDQKVQAKVIDVIWTASKDGYLKPRVQLEPIQLGGVLISFATGFNGAFIKNNCIGPGAVVQIIRSGDVIPHIISTISPCLAGPCMPNQEKDEYIWSDSGVDIILKDVNSSIDVREKNITNFFKKIEVEGLGQGNVTRLISAGQDSIIKICNMSQEDFLKVEGFAKKMAEKIYLGIRERLQKVSLAKLMSASNIFGRGFSDGKIETILQVCPNILTKPLPNPLPLIKGISEKSLQEFIGHIEEFNQLYKSLNNLPLIPSLKNGTINETINATILSQNVLTPSLDYGTIWGHAPILNKIIVLTGFRDKNLVEYIEKNGGKIAAAVTKKTDFVIAKDINDNSSKMMDAKKYEIPILLF
jgi:DNA ligase (NAD+)